MNPGMQLARVFPVPFSLALLIVIPVGGSCAIDSSESTARTAGANNGNELMSGFESSLFFVRRVRKDKLPDCEFPHTSEQPCRMPDGYSSEVHCSAVLLAPHKAKALVQVREDELLLDFPWAIYPSEARQVDTPLAFVSTAAHCLSDTSSARLIVSPYFSEQFAVGVGTDATSTSRRIFPVKHVVLDPDYSGFDVEQKTQSFFFSAYDRLSEIVDRSHVIHLLRADVQAFRSRGSFSQFVRDLYDTTAHDFALLLVSPEIYDHARPAVVSPNPASEGIQTTFEEDALQIKRSARADQTTIPSWSPQPQSPHFDCNAEDTYHAVGYGARSYDLKLISNDLVSRVYENRKQRVEMCNVDSEYFNTHAMQFYGVPYAGIGLHENNRHVFAARTGFACFGDSGSGMYANPRAVRFGNFSQTYDALLATVVYGFWFPNLADTIRQGTIRLCSEYSPIMTMSSQAISGLMDKVHEGLTSQECGWHSGIARAQSDSDYQAYLSCLAEPHTFWTSCYLDHIAPDLAARVNSTQFYNQCAKAIKSAAEN